MLPLEARIVLAAPQVVVISLDGATPTLVDQYLASGVLDPDSGLGFLRSRGIAALQNLTVTPSLTAPGHIAIATGSSAANNDINGNTFRLLASPFNTNISGFGAPIGGYDIHGPGESDDPTAEPIWAALRAAGRTVIAATFPGADGAEVRIPGLANSPVLQPAAERTVDYTVPFGEFGGQGARGFTLSAANFGPAPQATVDQLTAAGRVSRSPVLQTSSGLESFTINGVPFALSVAALDTTDDGVVNYDSLAIFDTAQGIQPGPFALPSTGPAYLAAGDQESAPFYLEGSPRRAGTAFYLSALTPDLSTVRLTRYSVNNIPRTSPVAEVLADVDDINNNAGFWAPQPDFRIPERLSPGFTGFPDIELEAIYEDQVRTFVDYQTRVVLRAFEATPDADLGLFYIEQPDGSEHQFLLTDPRQPSDFTDPNSIGAGQDPAKVARYRGYLEFAYQTADRAVQRILDAVGTDANGQLNSNVIVVSDHGIEPFHTAVAVTNVVNRLILPNVNAALAASGLPAITASQIRAVTSGPAVNIYLNLLGRDPAGGAQLTRQQYLVAQPVIAQTLATLLDLNPNYTLGAASVPVFDEIYSRPTPADINAPDFGLGTGEFIGQDTGDVFALLTSGYNFDGTQSPVVVRRDDPASTAPILSVPNFYGAHGYDPTRPEMSAIFYAAGPDIGRGVLPQVRNIDVAPTIARLLGVTPAATVQGTAIDLGRQPAANPDSFRVSRDAPTARLEVLSNDAAVIPGARVAIVAVGPAAHGRVRVSDDGRTVLYSPDPGYSGPDSFQYTVDHIPVGLPTLAATATVTLDVTPLLPNGVAAGDTTRDSTVLWTHSFTPGPVTFVVATDSGFGQIVTTRSAQVSGPLTPVRVQVAGLAPSTDYFYRATDAAGATGTGRFRTAAGVGSYEGLHFGVSGDQRGELAPFPSIANADGQDLDFFAQLGDTIYADFPSPDLPAPQALTRDDFRIKQNEVYSARLGLNTLADLRATTSTLATIDDHEVTNDFAGGASPSSDPRFAGQTGAFINETPLFRDGVAAFQEYNPLRDETYGATGDPRTAGKPRLYRSQTFGQDAGIFLLDNRSFRDRELAPVTDLQDPAQVGAFLAASFNPGRTMLGSQQFADLQRDLLAARDAGVTWKFIFTAEPIQNFGVLAAGDRWEGYAAERTRLLRFIDENDITNVVFVAADFHGTTVNRLSYQLGPGMPQIQTDAFEIITGPTAFDQPFGPTVVDLATGLGLITPAQNAFYDSLPEGLAKEQFIAGLINPQLMALGYNPLSPTANPLPNIRLVNGLYMATAVYGWTEFAIDPQTQQLTVRTYGITPYSRAQLEANPAAVTGSVPQVVGEFVVTPILAPSARLVGADLVINGGAGDDRFVIRPAGADARIVVEANGQVLGEFATGAGGRIVVDGLGGTDAVRVDGSSTGGDAFLVRAGGAGRTTLSRTNLAPFALDLSSIESLDIRGIDGAGGGDSLTVDFGAGNPIPSGGIAYDGGAGPDNRLVLTPGGGPFAAVDETYAATGPGSGTIVLNGSTITFARLRSTVDTVPAARFTFQAPSAFAQEVRFTAGPAVGGTPTMQISSGAVPEVFGAVTIANKAAVTIAGSSGFDTVSIEGAGGLTPTTIPVAFAGIESVNLSNGVNAPPVIGPAPALSGIRGRALTDVIVARFTDADPGSVPGEYVATIDWGDGTLSTPGTVVADPGAADAFLIRGSHIYNATGTFTVTVTVQDLGRILSSTGVNGVPVATVVRSIPAVSAAGSTATIAAEPVPGPLALSGALDAASDSGVSNADRITNDNTPTFLGQTEPGAIVQLTGPGVSPTLLGQAVADASGTWRITSLPLPDGVHALSVNAVDGTGSRRATAALFPVVIDTVGPRITGLQLDRRTGRLFIGVQDPDSVAGLDDRTPVPPASVGFNRASARNNSIPVTSLLIMGPPGSPALRTIAATLNGGQPLPGTRFVLMIGAGAIMDLAGNALDGAFSGSFPTGIGRPGTDFVAAIDVARRRISVPRSQGSAAETIGRTIVITGRNGRAASVRLAFGATHDLALAQLIATGQVRRPGRRRG